MTRHKATNDMAQSNTWYEGRQDKTWCDTRQVIPWHMSRHTVWYCDTRHDAHHSLTLYTIYHDIRHDTWHITHNIPPVLGAVARLALLDTVSPSTLSSFTLVLLLVSFSSFLLLRVLSLLTWGAPPPAPSPPPLVGGKGGPGPLLAPSITPGHHSITQ